MSHILALDSSTDACSVALYADGQLHAHFELAAKSHTQRLLPMVDELLQANNLKLQNLDAIAFGRGPGSFTGLRICMGIVQGLAFGAQLPVIPVSTLETMALGYYRANPSENMPVLVSLDARMDEVYWGLFTRNGEGVEALSDEFVMKPELLSEQAVIQQLAGKFIAVGPGWHYPAMQALAASNLVVDAQPHAENMALIAAQVWTEGGAVDVLDAQPVYLRDTISWQKRQRIRNPN
ncbi:tRNA (adenosine(37)-N6)-threonylcarbamoyltransferase complex dimerization subunit type 1 TsaB [Cellvibrio sp. NN19]|uniref:tRNA (adenosine(37)-N6)-threonylcarbamoyltransferase complex dimerization subunit type 1 TsaB n=1 Tax=Cellvibrio chitinivorans TaxID=3102792 RepID=UPI002B417DE5|nr:tRNA (adenosine(37)-N6)-threonylcarbamoyltransferase complex dimerization subunit type 1 TsaB [Cellvibrio sp. NN19]